QAYSQYEVVAALVADRIDDLAQKAQTLLGRPAVSVRTEIRGGGQEMGGQGAGRRGELGSVAGCALEDWRGLAERTYEGRDLAFLENMRRIGIAWCAQGGRGGRSIAGLAADHLAAQVYDLTDRLHAMRVNRIGASLQSFQNPGIVAFDQRAQ